MTKHAIFSPLREVWVLKHLHWAVAYHLCKDRGTLGNVIICYILEIYNILQTITIKQIYFRACDMIWVTDFNHKLPFLNFQVGLQSIYCSHLTNPSAVGFAKSGAQAAQVDPGRMIGKLHAVLQLGELTYISPIWLMLQVKWG